MVIALALLELLPAPEYKDIPQMRLSGEGFLMFVIAFRFIPTLQIEGRRIHKAQLARGYQPGTGLMGKLRSVSPIVIPLVSNALSRANTLGLTTDIRGYRNPAADPDPRIFVPEARLRGCLHDDRRRMCVCRADT